MRLPFDPDRAQGAESARPDEQRDDDGCLSVTQLSELIRGTLERRIPSPLRVAGEVSNLRVQNHWYFSLKDGESVISCVAFASSARQFRFRPDDGTEVVATGHVSHFARQGRTQLYVQAMQPVGAGELELRFRAMCEELRGLGYFDEDRKRPIPSFPRKIAVITSAHGAALQDVLSTAAHRCPAVGLLLVDVRVQGDGAAADVARAIRWVDAEQERLGVDAIVLTRGGGSIEDLWAFNERVVADAVFDCGVPIVAAIGHESDTTVAELVADLRAATPTQAAMRLVPDRDELRQQVDHLEHRLAFVIQRNVEQGRTRVESAARALAATIRHRLADQQVRLERLATRWAKLQSPAGLQERGNRLAVLEDRLRRAIVQRVAAERQRIDALERRLDAIDPRQVLARGFSYTTQASGELVRSKDDASAGDELVTHVADGTIRSVVGGATRRRGSAGQEREAPQMDLFERGR